MNCRPAALAKLSAPRIFAALARERLFALLDRGLKQTSVWVSGPPGSGKSTLAASYLESRRIAGLWYQIDGGDSDPASFFHYLRFAVDRSRRRKSPALPLFTPDHLRDLSGFARRYFRDLFSRLPVDSVLVLDNYQEAALSSDLHKVVSIALEEMPAGIGLIVLSREGPPPEFARWLAGERIYLLNWDALQLTLDETRRIAGSRIEVDEQSIEALHRQCAGWAGGLTLMLDEIRRSGTFESLHHMETFGTLFDYFAHQVFSAAPQRLRDFLVRTAALPRMTPDTAREISGQAEAARALDDLYRRRLFTDRRMGSPPTYQYHTLFRGFLSARAVDMLGADEWARTTRHAGQLLEEHGLLDDAVDVYRSIQDWEGVVRIIRSCAPTLLTQGQAKMLSHWIEYLPRSRLQADAWLPYWHGMAMLTVHPGRARESLEQAYALFEPSDHVEGQLRSTSGIIQARFLETVDHRTIDPWLEVSARLLMVADGTCPADVRLRAHSAMMIGALYRQPGNPALNASVQQVLALLESDADTNDKLAAAGFLLVYTGYTGDIKTAARIIPIGTLLAEAPDATPMNRGMWFSWLGYNHLYSLEPESAGRALDRAARIGEHENLRSVAFIADYFQGMLKRSLHQYDQAREHLKAMRAICDERSLVQTAICHALAGWLAVLPEGNLDQAIEHGRSAWTIARQLGSPSYLVHWGTPLIFGLIERGEIEEGLALLNEQRAALAGTAIRCYDPVFLCVDATVAARRGDECSALELTARMFSLAKSAGHGAYLTLDARTL